MRECFCFRRIACCLLFGLLILLAPRSGETLSSPEATGALNEAALRLVQFCNDPKVGLDEEAVATLVDYVLSPKQNKEHALPQSQKCSGAYYEFDTKVSFSRFVEYSYNPLIPAVITRPSSVRYSTWAGLQDDTHRLLGNWKPLPAAAPAVIIHGMQREADTPDLNARVYHEYDLKRTLVLLNYKDRQVLISVSKQVGKSGVGKKGGILGNDSDWSYYYSGVPGSPQTGLGWVKSYIYDCFSVGVYVESKTAPGTVRSGVFHWLCAGWSGINFVKSSHIIGGLRRFGHSAKTILESPRLPAPNQIITVSQWLSSMPIGELTRRYTALQQALRSSAFQVGLIGKSALEEQVSFGNTPKEQMVEELMLEYLKITLGKQAHLSPQFFSPAPKPLS
jgi:hypothetical protein